MSAPRHVVIVGRDAPAWLSACVLQFALAPAGIRVTVVELPSRAHPADVWISQPALEPLHARLRIDEARLISATGGTFSLGRRCIDTLDGNSFFLPHGSVGGRIDHKEFLPQWLRARDQGLKIPFEEFSLAAAAARQGRMLLPDAEIDAMGHTDYGYHLPAISYATWLRQLAVRRGVQCQVARAVDVQRDSRGHIHLLRLDGGREVPGDFFLDVSGQDAVLATALGTPVESWRHTFIVDRVMHAHSALASPPPVYSEIRIHDAGWTSLAASQSCVHVERATCSDLEGDTAEDVRGLRLDGIVIRESRPGRRVRAWDANCVGLGEAACVFDPLHSLDLHTVQVGLVHLLPLFPVRGDFDAERDEYNQNVRAAFGRMRDFQHAHYHLNRHGGSGFWTRARAARPGVELAHKIDAFRARGEPVDYEHESFSIDDWRALFIGLGVVPESWDPAVDGTPAETLRHDMQRILGFVRHKSAAQRPHAEYLRSLATGPR
jgi:tryptophan 7-halogenase